MDRHLTGNGLRTPGNTSLAVLLSAAALGISACGGKDTSPVVTVKAFPVVPEKVITPPDTGGTPYISYPSKIGRQP